MDKDEIIKLLKEIGVLDENKLTRLEITPMLITCIKACGDALEENGLERDDLSFMVNICGGVIEKLLANKEKKEASKELLKHLKKETEDCAKAYIAYIKNSKDEEDD